MGKCSYIQTKAILHITSLATALFVADVNRSLDNVTDLLPRMHMPILKIQDMRRRNFSAYPRCDHRVWLISFFSNHLGQTRVKITAFPRHTAGCKHYNRGERTVFYLLNALIICPFLFFLVDFVGFLEALVRISVGVWVEYPYI